MSAIKGFVVPGLPQPLLTPELNEGGVSEGGRSQRMDSGPSNHPHLLSTVNNLTFPLP